MAILMQIDVVSPEDGGNYTCMVGQVGGASVSLHVVDTGGEHKLFMVNRGHNLGQFLAHLIVIVVMVTLREICDGE